MVLSLSGVISLSLIFLLLRDGVLALQPLWLSPWCHQSKGYILRAPYTLMGIHRHCAEWSLNMKYPLKIQIYSWMLHTSFQVKETCIKFECRWGVWGKRGGTRGTRVPCNVSKRVIPIRLYFTLWCLLLFNYLQKLNKWLKERHIVNNNRRCIVSTDVAPSQVKKKSNLQFITSEINLSCQSFISVGFLFRISSICWNCVNKFLHCMFAHHKCIKAQTGRISIC
jgi:hypothetical protein